MFVYLFVTIKVVHLDLVSDLTTELFIAATQTD